MKENPEKVKFKKSSYGYDWHIAFRMNLRILENKDDDNDMDSIDNDQDNFLSLPRDPKSGGTRPHWRRSTRYHITPTPSCIARNTLLYPPPTTQDWHPKYHCRVLLPPPAQPISSPVWRPPGSPIWWCSSLLRWQCRFWAAMPTVNQQRQMEDARKQHQL